MVSNARKVAALALLRVQKDDAYSNIAINEAIKNASLSKLDAAFASKLFYGALERKITLDYYIRHFSSQPLSRVSPFVLSVLRCGVYQLLFMDKVPQSAAVNESVNIIKKSKDSRASGYVNAVLRNVIRDLPKLPAADSVKGLSINYSCSEELVKLYVDDYGIEETKKFLSNALNDSSVYIRVNTLKNTCAELAKKLKEQDITVSNTQLENALCLSDCGSIENNPLFLEGRFHVQDISSQICADSLSAQPGDFVIDMCAAPGGKSFTIAENMQNKGEVISCDLHDHRVKLIANGAARLGLDIISANALDATQNCENFNGKFDRVLCDVPCSGSGVIGRKPDIKYKDFSDLSELCTIQFKILQNGFMYLKPGGTLVYSTCSVLKAENDSIVDKLLKKFDNAELFKKHTFLPQNDGTDGFFTAVIKKMR